MSTDSNRAIARRYYYEVFNQGSMDTLEEICAPDFEFTLPTHSETYRGVEGYKGLVNMLRGCFPDIHFAVEDMLAEGDRVLSRWTARGTHTGIPFPTILGDVPAIGNSFLIEGMSWHRIVDGKIVEVRANEDGLGLILQLGFALFPNQAPVGRPTPATPEASKKVVGRYFDEVMNQGNLAVIDEILAPDFAFRIPTLPDPVRGRDGMKSFVTGLHSGFPDIRFTPDLLLVDGDRVAAHYTMTGTQKGEFLGVAASGRAVNDRGTDLFHLSGEQILGVWVSEDALGLMEQMGAIKSSS